MNIKDYIENYFENNSKTTFKNRQWIYLQNADLKAVIEKFRFRRIYIVKDNSNLEKSSVLFYQVGNVVVIILRSVANRFDLLMENERHIRKKEKFLKNLSKLGTEMCFFYLDESFPHFINYGWGCYRNGKCERIFIFNGDYVEVIFDKGLPTEMEHTIKYNQLYNNLNIEHILDIARSWNANPIALINDGIVFSGE